MVIKSIIEKIISMRKEKGYSHENMAHALCISQAAYSKIETGKTKLSVDRLYQIAKILERPVRDILSINVIETDHALKNEPHVDYSQLQYVYQELEKKSEKIEQLYISKLDDKDLMLLQLNNIIIHLTKI